MSLRLVLRSSSHSFPTVSVLRFVPCSDVLRKGMDLMSVTRETEQREAIDDGLPSGLETSPTAASPSVHISPLTPVRSRVFSLSSHLLRLFPSYSRSLRSLRYATLTPLASQTERDEHPKEWGEWRRREAGEWRVTDGSRRYATEGIIMWAVCLVTRPASRPSRLSLILHSIHSCRRRDVGEAKVREVEGGRDEGTARYTSLTPLVPRAVSVPSPTSLRSGSLRSLRYARWEGHEWWT